MVKILVAGLVAGILIGLGLGNVRAADHPAAPTQVQCDAIRAIVKVYGEDAAEAMARSQGWTDLQIARARRCLSRK